MIWRTAKDCNMGECVEVAALSWCAAKDCNSGHCVEVAATPGGIGIRDSKDPDGPVLSFDRREFAVFAAGVKAGDFDDMLE